MTLYKWSRTAASNSNADSTINWAENQAPSSVNDSARALMAAAAKARDDRSGALETGGSSTAYTATSYQVTTALTDGFSITLQMHEANGAAPTLNVDATGAKAIRTRNGTAVPESAMGEDSVHTFVYDSSDNCWYVHGFFITTTLALTGLDINGATELTAPAVDDELPIYDLSATGNRKITLANFFEVINGLTEETEIALDDYLPLYDTSGPTADKITPVNLLEVLNLLTEDTAPDEAADFLLSYDASASTVKKVKPYNLIVPGAIMCIAEDNKSSGNGGGTLGNGADNIRTLNTLIYNRNSLFSLSSNRLTVPAGTWEIEWRAPVAGDADNGSHQSLLYNQTEGETVKRGTSEEYNATSGGEMSNASVGSTVVTIAESTAFEIRHRVGFSGGTMTGGDSVGAGTEVYTRLIVRAA